MMNRLLLGIALAGFLLIVASLPVVRTFAQEVSDQIILRMDFVKQGVSSQGDGVLQVGEVNTLSAAVAATALTEVVAAPSSGSIYLRGLLIEKSTGATGTVTVKSGTGTNCATGTATILGPITNPQIGYAPLNILVAAGDALCLQTEATTTGVRALTN